MYSRSRYSGPFRWSLESRTARFVKLWPGIRGVPTVCDATCEAIASDIRSASHLNEEGGHPPRRRAGPGGVAVALGAECRIQNGHPA